MCISNNLIMLKALYDDGDIEVLCLDKEKWKLVKSGHKLVEVCFLVFMRRFCLVGWNVMNHSIPSLIPFYHTLQLISDDVSLQPFTEEAHDI